MPQSKDHTTPVSDIDAAARAAFLNCVRASDGPEAIARRHDTSVRTIERIYTGRRDVPPGLATDMADDTHTSQADADALRAWADDCRARTAQRRA